MPRYSPLPSVSIDPRNEAQIVQGAAQRVYQASGQALNDFSSGNPLSALLEGQAFAQGEFLFWANQLPQSILVEWLGPFLGAMRRLGTPATARLSITVPPSSKTIRIPAGTVFTTDSDLTGGETYTFVSSTEISIPPGETEANVSVSSQFVGSQYNSPANSITGVSAIGINGLSVTNPQPAAGGSDVETYQQVQERFFTIIRRRNPVSAEDWQDFFTDFYGEGTQTSVQPNRPNQGPYKYDRDYLYPNGQVSFFVLGPDGTELDQTQLDRGQNVVNYSVPVENRGHLYPMTLSQVHYELTAKVNTNGSFGGNLRNSSLSFRDRLFEILRPGNFFSPSTDPSVSDVDAAFYSTFDANTRFIDPTVELSAAYNTPPSLEKNSAIYTKVYQFDPSGDLLNQDDLIETPLPVPTYYPVLSSFTPYSGDKRDQSVYGNLSLQQIVNLVPGNFVKGQVCYWAPSVGGDGELHVILENLSVGGESEVAQLITDSRISSAKTYSAWTTGNSYTVGTGGSYNPEIVEYDYVSGDQQFIPNPNSIVPLNKRPGAMVWTVAQDFVLQPSTNNITGAQANSLIGADITPRKLSPGTTYNAGEWVFTPQVGSGPGAAADPYYNYVDLTKGVVSKYAKVIKTFTYSPNERTVNSYFEELLSDSVIKEIRNQVSVSGLPIYKYKPRFPATTYLEYRENSTANPEYYIAAKDFTPPSTDIQDLISKNLVFPLYINDGQYQEFVQGIASGSVKSPTRMFRFFKGDRTFFRQGTKVLSYTATTNVHTLFSFDVYKDNKVFVPSGEVSSEDIGSTEYIPFFNPSYAEYAEDTIINSSNRNLYRVMFAFVPASTVVDWTNTTVSNTPRIEEYAGNLLRYVNKYECDDKILSQLGKEISAIKLGSAEITIVPRTAGGASNTSSPRSRFVWETTSTIEEVPQLSWFSGTSYPYSPPQYKDGTLRL